jgi:sugar/nucleoside kinase (ribokinase family)
MRQVDVTMVGHFARDVIVVDGRAVPASGGAVYYGGIAARRMGLSVAVVTRLHPSDRAYLDELVDAGIEVYAADAAETSGIENTYDSSDMERRVCRPLGFAGRIAQHYIPELASLVYMVVPIMAGEVDFELLHLLARRGPVALDVQGFVRVREGDRLVFRPWDNAATGLAHVTYLKADRAEAALLTGESDLSRAARALAAMGPQEIVLTESAGVTVFAGGGDSSCTLYPAIPRRPNRTRGHVLCSLRGQATEHESSPGLPLCRRRDHAQAGAPGPVVR